LSNPYGRNPKTATPADPPPRTNIGQEPSGFEPSVFEVDLVFAARDFAARIHVEADDVARLLARSLYAALDAARLSSELINLADSAKASGALDGHAQVIDELCQRWLDRPKPKKRGRGKTAEPPATPNPDNGHGAGDGFGGTDFPPTFPGPDKDRPQ
jgi:hypothetical protein